MYYYSQVERQTCDVKTYLFNILCDCLCHILFYVLSDCLCHVSFYAVVQPNLLARITLSFRLIPARSGREYLNQVSDMFNGYHHSSSI